MRTIRRLCALVCVLVATAPAFGQITWNLTYSDGNIQAGGIGFADANVATGETISNGLLRRNSVVAATQYLNRYLDGRGTINANLNTSFNTNNGVLASFGAGQYTGLNGSFQAGGFYQAARANQRPFPTTGPTGTPPNQPLPDGSGQWNFFYGWNYIGQNAAPSASKYDMVTVAIHELTHGIGFLSLADPNGLGISGSNSTLGNQDIYSSFDRWLQRGSGAFNSTSRLFNTDITSGPVGGVGGYGSFTGSASTFTNNNDPATGLFFGGAFAREVYGGAVPMFAPTTYQDGSSVSHVNDTNAVMNPSVAANVVKRFRPYEVAMLLDIGWNVYQWNETTGATGNWSTGSTNVANSKWRSDSGIVYNGSANGGNTFNLNSSQNPAPVLPVYGQVTANIVLNFRNNGTTAYTSSNDLGSVRLSRLTFGSTNATGGITIAGGTLNFGENSDLSPSVLVPKVIQNGAAPVTISSAIQVNTIADTLVDGVTFTGHSGVTVEGAGSGLVTIGGVVSGTGGITKNSSTFNLVLSGTNTYTGGTTVNAGSLFVNGNSGGATGAVAVNSGGTLTGNGTVGGAVTVNNGGAIEGGNAGLGTLTVNNNVTVNGGGKLQAQLGATGTADRLNMSAGNHTLDLKSGTVLALSNSTFSGTSFLLADLNGTTLSLLKINGVDQALNSDITVFTSTGGNAGNESNANIDFQLTGFSLTSGDKLTLRRDANGDLVLTFTPVPEPAGVLLVCGLVTAGGVAWRRWKRKPADVTGQTAA